MRSRAVTAAHEDKILDALKAAPKDGLSGVELAKARDGGVNLCMARSREWSTMAEFAPYDKPYSSRFY